MNQPAPANTWPDSEVAVINWLAAWLPKGMEVRAEASPNSLKPPFVLVRRIPGGEHDGVSETAIVDVDVFGANRAAMWTLARQVQAAMLALSAHTAKTGLIDEVQVESNFGHVDYGNPNLRRAVATFRLTTRPQATA